MRGDHAGSIEEHRPAGARKRRRRPTCSIIAAESTERAHRSPSMQMALLDWSTRPPDRVAGSTIVANRPIAARSPPNPEVPRADHRPRGRLQRPAPRQRPARHRGRGPPRAGRRGQPLVRRRLQARGRRQDRVRAPVRARHVPGLAPRRQGRAHRARPGRRRDDERLDLARPDELLRDACRRTSWSSPCGSRRTGWRRCSTRSARRTSTTSARSSRTRSAGRTTTARTARGRRSSRPTCSRPSTRTTTRRSARWRTSTRPRSRTSARFFRT